MKRSLLILALTAVLLMSAVPAGATPPEATGDQTWIVTLAPGTPAVDHATRIVEPLGGSVRYAYHHALNGFAFRGSEQAARGFEHDPNVLRVEPDRALYMTGEMGSNGFIRIDADDTYYSGERGKQANGASVRNASARELEEADCSRVHTDSLPLPKSNAQERGQSPPCVIGPWTPLINVALRPDARRPQTWPSPRVRW